MADCHLRGAPPDPVLAFDIETIPDIAGLRLLHGLPDTDVSDADVAEYAFQRQRQKTAVIFAASPAPGGGDFLRAALG